MEKMDSNTSRALLRFVIGAAGSGKTYKCLDEILSTSLESRVVSNAPGLRVSEMQKILLVPDQSTAQYERELLRRSKCGTLTGVNVTGFSRLPFFLQTIGTPRASSSSRCEQRIVLYKAVKEVAEHAPTILRNIDKTGTLDQILDFFDELRTSGISPLDFSSAVDTPEKPWLQIRASELSYVLTEYELQLKKHSLTDALGASAEYANSLSAMEHSENIKIWIDGFSHFSKIELSILRELMRICETITFSILVTSELLDGTRGTPEELICKTILGRPLETYIEIDRLGNELKLKREYIDLDKASFPRRWLPKSQLCVAEELLRSDIDYSSITFNRKAEFEIASSLESTDECAIQIVEVPTRIHEIRFVARNIRKLISKGYRFKDIAVLSRSLDNYSELIKTQFSRYSLPNFIDMPEVISSHPVVKLVRLLITYPVEPSLGDFFEIARNPLIGLDRASVDAFENYVLEKGIHIDELGSKSLNDRISSNSKQFEELNSKLINPLAFFTNRIRTLASSVEMSSELIDFLNVISIASVYEEYAYSDDSWSLDVHKAAWSEVFGAVTSLADVCGYERINLMLYRDLLLAALNTVSVKISPPTIDQISVSDLDRGRQMNPKIVFIVGNLEGEFPNNSAPSGLLSSDERLFVKSRGIRLENDGVSRYFYERYLFYVACTRPSYKLYLTIPIKESNDAVKSSFLTMIPDCIANTVSSSEEEVPSKLSDATTIVETVAWCLNSKCYEDPNEVLCKFLGAREGDDEKIHLLKLISLSRDVHLRKRDLTLQPEIRKLRVQDDNRLSVSKLQTLSQCPFKHFSTYNLKLEERKEAKVKPLDIGLIFHQTLKLTLDRAIERNIPWRGGDLSLLLSILNESFSGVVSDEEADWASSSFNRMIANNLWMDIKAFFESTIGILNIGEFDPVLGEWAFGSYRSVSPSMLTITSKDGCKFTITGQIDRIDFCSNGNYLKVIDYKNRVKKVDWTEVYYGFDLQLLMYGFALIKLNEILVSAIKSKVSDSDIQSDDEAPVTLKPAVLLRHAIHPELINKNTAFEADSFAYDNKLRGIVLYDAACLLNRVSAKGVYGFRFNKNGGIADITRSDVVSAKELEVIWTWFESKLEEMIEVFESGEITPQRIQVSQTVSCEYCPYASVCRIVSRDMISRLPIPTVDGKNTKLGVISRMNENCAEGNR